VDWRDNFKKWPLLILGVTLLLAAIPLADPPDREGIRAFLLALGAVLIGAGLVLISIGQVNRIHDDAIDEFWKRINDRNLQPRHLKVTETLEMEDTPEPPSTDP
jgi:hypothetical protein